MYPVVRRTFVRRSLPAFLISALLLLSVASLPPLRPSGPAYAATLPERPRVLLDTTYALPQGRTIAVPAGGDFQAALNTAAPGDVITLQAGATYSGNFTLPAKTGSLWIYIQSSALAGLPAPGTRVGPAHAPLMPKIVGNPAIAAPSGAHHYRFAGIEFHPPAGVSVLSLISLSGSDLVLDRSYIHGNPGEGSRHGVALNGTRNAVIDSYISDWKHTTLDSQAIQGWNGPGPYKIVNNYLEAAGENLMFGGTDASSSANMPSDIEIRGNYLFKPLAWKVGDPAYAGTNWVVKNIFELKNARRVLVEGNVFENNWTGNTNSQGGLAIVLTPRNQYGGNPWAAVQDVTFIRNVVRRSTAGVFFLGWDDNNSSQQLQRILVQDNLFTDIGLWPDVIWNFFTGMLFFMKNGPADITINHNTAFQTAHPVYGQDLAGRGPTTGFVYTNNLTPNGRGVGGSGSPLQSLNTYFTGSLFIRNVLVGGDPLAYPADNLFPGLLGEVGFVDYAAGDYRLSPASPFKYLGTDGKDLGADLGAVAEAAAGAVSGRPPASADTTPPAVALIAPLNGSTVSGTVTVSAAATDNVGVVGVQFTLSGTTLGSEDTTNAYAVAWDSTALSNGTYTLTAVARDAAGNRTTSAPVTVTVSNPSADTAAPAISGVTVSSVTTSGATVTWSTNEPASSQVQYGTGTGYGSAASSSGAVTAHAVPLSGLAAGTLYHFRVMSRDAAGNLATSGDHTFTTASAAAPARSPFKGTPWPVPGQIEAEDFDEGGEGVAYHDATPGNQGGLYRSGIDVDIVRAPDGAHVVNNFQTGEWLEYTIGVGKQGSYVLQLLVSSEFTTARWRAAVDGVDVTGPVAVPHTGSWNTFQWVGTKAVRLDAGTHVLRIAADQEYFNVAALRIVRRAPYNGAPSAVPGQIEAEDFDLGAEGVAYNDATPGNQGGLYRPDADVDIVRAPDGAHVVNNFQTGEWLEYTIQVAQAGTYRLELLVSSELTTARWRAAIDGADVTGAVAVPHTGSWNTFQWVARGGIALGAGTHVLRIYAEQQYFNFAALRLSVE